MRNYREVAEAVLERRDAYEKKRKHTRRIVIRTAAGTGGLCLATLLGLWIYGEGSLSPDSAGMSPSGSETYYALSDSGASNADDSKGLPATGSAADGSGNPAVSSENVGDGTAISSENAGGDGTAVSSDGNGTAAPGAGADGNAPANSGNSNGAQQLPPGQESVSADGGLLPVSYSSLDLPQGQISPVILTQFSAGSQSTADVLPFSEDMLSESSAILEGRITDMYLKRYTYDTYNDKFGPRELYHNQSSSVVYELTVDRVWHGDESLSGASVLIEDDTYLMDSYFSLKVGRSYVIPVCDLDSEKAIWEEYAGGDLTRDGRYTTLYPHHPQIEVTSDGDYIVTTEWGTLCPDSARDIDLDVPENTLVEYHPENEAGKDGLITTEWRTLMISAYDAIFYYDKMKLVSADEFFIQLDRLLDKYLSP